MDQQHCKEKKYEAVTHCVSNSPPLRNEEQIAMLTRMHLAEHTFLMQLQEAQKQQLLQKQQLEQASMTLQLQAAAIVSTSGHMQQHRIRPQLNREESFDLNNCQSDGALSSIMKLNQSAAVKANLREIILSKRQRFLDASHSPSDWQSPQSSFESQDSSPTGACLTSSPETSPDDFRLRKTLSEPNLKVKSALKQKVIERRSSPLLKRQFKCFLEKQQQAKAQQVSMPMTAHDIVSTATPVVTAHISPRLAAYPKSLTCDLYASLPNLPVLSRFSNAVAASSQSKQCKQTLHVAVAAHVDEQSGIMPDFCNDNKGSDPIGAVDFLCEAAGNDIRSNNRLLYDRNQHNKDKEPFSNNDSAASEHAGHAVTLEENNSASTFYPTHAALLRTLSAPLTPSSHSAQTNVEINLSVKAQLRQKVLQRSASEDVAIAPNCTQIKIEESGELGALPCNYPPSSVLPSFRYNALVDRTTSSPSMKLPSPIAEEISVEFATSAAAGMTPCLAYDNGMLAHHCICGRNDVHPENPTRLQAVLIRLTERGLLGRFDRVRSRRATIEELMSVHSEMYTILFGASAVGKSQLDPVFLSTFTPCLLPCGGIGIDAETVWNEASTASAARLAVGCVLEVAFRVAQSESRNGLALVRPPGHHAEHSQAMGFCYFNAVAVAASRLLESKCVRRVAVLDWDVHHGNGTQQIFYENPQVLYVSIHRWDNGAFFPGTGAPMEVGKGAGIGRNVNIAWSCNEPLHDAEYAAAFRSIILPILREFCPDIVLVSAGFDAASGNSVLLGGYELSPGVFAYMTQELTMHFEGRLVMTLEGGYDLQSLSDCLEAVVRVLLGENSTVVHGAAHWLSESERCRKPSLAAVQCLHAVVQAQLPYWECLGNVNHESLSLSWNAAYDKETTTAAATDAMASLTVRTQKNFDVLKGGNMDFT